MTFPESVTAAPGAEPLRSAAALWRVFGSAAITCSQRQTMIPSRLPMSSSTTALAALGAVLAYVVFEWGGVVRTDQYQYLLVLGLLAMVLSLGRVHATSGHRFPAASCAGP